MSLETLLLLQKILHGVTLDGRAPDFEETAVMVLKARKELAEAIDKAQKDS